MTQLGSQPDKCLTAVELASAVLAYKAQPQKQIYGVKHRSKDRLLTAAAAEACSHTAPRLWKPLDVRVTLASHQSHSVQQSLLTCGKTASRSRKISCSKPMNTTDSWGGLTNTTAVFVLGALKALGLLPAWEAFSGSESRQERSYSQAIVTWDVGTNWGVIYAAA